MKCLLPPRMHIVLVVLAAAVSTTWAQPITITPTRTGIVSGQIYRITGNVWGYKNQRHATGAFSMIEHPEVSADGYWHTRWNSYSVMDLSGVQARVSSANFQGTLAVGHWAGWWGDRWYNGNDQATESFALWDVTTDPQTLLTLPEGFVMNPNGGIITDLASGVNYANATASSSQVGQALSVSLTAQAIADLNAARGGYFSIGGSPTSGQTENLLLQSPRLVMYMYGMPVSGGGGIDFELDQGVRSGDGEVDLTDLGQRHRLRAVAVSQQMRDEKFSEVRRRFVFEAGGSTDPQMIGLIGRLDGRLDAGDGIATCLATMHIYDTSNTLLGTDMHDDAAVSLGLNNPQTEMVNEDLLIEVELTPGQTYEVISRIELVADISGPDGSCEANFENTFEVELYGVPEPATLSLLALGALTLMRRRRK